VGELVRLQDLLVAAEEGEEVHQSPAGEEVVVEVEEA